MGLFVDAVKVLGELQERAMTYTIFWQHLHYLWPRRDATQATPARGLGPRVERAALVSANNESYAIESVKIRLLILTMGPTGKGRKWSLSSSRHGYATLQAYSPSPQAKAAAV